MKILVVAAMRSELKAFAKRFPAQADTPTAVLGMGTKLAREGTARLLEEHRPDHVLMVGIAGGVGPTVAVGDLVVPEVVLDHASGTEHRPAPLPGFANRGILHTSDEFIVEPDAVAALVDRGVIALDMETAAVAAASEAAGVPWGVARGISDHHESLPVDPAVLAMTGPEGEPKAGAVAKYLAKHPGQVPHLAKLAKGANAAMAASSDAAVDALRRLRA